MDVLLNILLYCHEQVASVRIHVLSLVWLIFISQFWRKWATLKLQCIGEGISDSQFNT